MVWAFPVNKEQTALLLLLRTEKASEILQLCSPGVKVLIRNRDFLSRLLLWTIHSAWCQTFFWISELCKISVFTSLLSAILLLSQKYSFTLCFFTVSACVDPNLTSTSCVINVLCEVLQGAGSSYFNPHETRAVERIQVTLTGVRLCVHVCILVY